MQYVRETGEDKGLPYWKGSVDVTVGADNAFVLRFLVENISQCPYPLAHIEVINPVVLVITRDITTTLTFEADLHRVWASFANNRIAAYQRQRAEADVQQPIYEASLSAYRNHKIDHALTTAVE